MSTGTVKFFNETKGFGFIIEDDSQNEIFVHSSGLKESIKQNDKVAFSTTQGKKGINAIDVTKIS